MNGRAGQAPATAVAPVSCRQTIHSAMYRMLNGSRNANHD